MISLKKHEHILIATLFVLTNFLIKGIFLSSNSLGGDEPFSVYHAQMDTASIIRLLADGNNPPLYEIILHFWIKIWGISEFSVRFPSLIFSSLTVLFIYKLGAKFLNKRIALYACVIFIFSDYQLLFAHEARVYALLGLLSVISMYYFLGILQHCYTDYTEKNALKSDIRVKLIILIVTNTLMIYAHYFGFFILAVQLMIFIFNKSFLTKYWKQLFLVAVVIGLLYLPNISIILTRFIESSSKGTWLKPVENIGNLFDQIFLFSNNNRFVYLMIISLLLAAVWKFFYRLKTNNYIKGFFLFVLIPLLFLTAYSIFFQIPFIWRLTSSKLYSIGFPLLIVVVNTIWLTAKSNREVSEKSTNGLIVFWFTSIFFLMFCISFYVPIFLDRYLMPAAIAFSLVMGISLDYLIQVPKYRYIITGAIIMLFVVTAKPNITNKRNVKETVAKITDMKDSHTLVLICPANFVLNFSYYYDRDIFKNYNTVDIYSDINKSLNEENIYGINNVNEVNYKEWNKIVFLDAAANFLYPDNNIKNELDANYVLTNEFHFYEIFNIFEYHSKH